MRRPDTIRQLHANDRIYGRCPTCEEDFPLERTLLFYPDASIPEAARQRLEARRADLHARATGLRERRRRAGDGAAQKAIDVNAGMNASPAVTWIVAFDGSALGPAREPVQRSIQRTLEAGNYEWRTVRTGKDGRIQTEGAGDELQ